MAHMDEMTDRGTIDGWEETKTTAREFRENNANSSMLRLILTAQALSLAIYLNR